MLKIINALIGQRNPLRLLWHRAKGILAATLYSFPGRALTVIGITGTDGKTTTVGMTAHILRHAGLKTGMLSTALVSIGEGDQTNAMQKTSPSPFLVQKFLRACVRNGCTHAVVECSSHGLVQGRLLFLFPDIAAITNTSPEHLDYHGTMEQYRKDKSILFQMLRGKGTKVLNGDDETCTSYRSIPSHRTITYSVQGGKSSDIFLSDMQGERRGSSATVRAKGESECKLILTVPGEFNLENALCAIACTKDICEVPTACAALKTFRLAPARLELIDAGQSFQVFVDFTITPAAFEKTLSTLRRMVGDEHHVLVLTGSCGDRMREKRPIIGKICSQIADVVVITNDEPYSEDPQKIIDEVWDGIDQSACEAKQIPDRREAMRWIFRQAKAGDAVLLCGLGSYPHIMTANGPVQWNEQEVAREVLNEELRIKNYT